MKAIKFPEDFVNRPDKVIPGAVRYLYEYKDDADNRISILGRSSDIYGDGITTFEVWDTKSMMVLLDMTVDEINEWLAREE